MIKIKYEIIWTGGLPHLPGVPYLHVNRPLIYSALCRVGYAKDRGSPSYIARNSFVFFCSPKFLHVSYFYVCAGTHEAIVHCEIDLASCTTGLYFPHSSTFLIRSHIPWGARETLWRFPSHYSIICMFLPDAP